MVSCLLRCSPPSSVTTLMSDLFSKNGWPSRTRMREKGLFGVDHSCISRGFFCRCEPGLLFRGCAKAFCRLPEISLYIFYYLPLSTKPLASMEKHQAGPKNEAVCFRKNHVAHEPHSVLCILLAKVVVSGLGLTLRTGSAVRETGQHYFHVLVQGRTSLQRMQVFQLIERSTLDKAVLRHGHRSHLKSLLGSRP